MEEKSFHIMADKTATPAERFRIVQEALKETNMRLQGVQLQKIRLEKMKKEIQELALEKFKENIKIEFSTKHGEAIRAGHITSEIMEEYDRIENMDKYGCYKLGENLRVEKKDCQFCPRRCDIVSDNEGRK